MRNKIILFLLTLINFFSMTSLSSFAKEESMHREYINKAWKGGQENVERLVAKSSDICVPQNAVLYICAMDEMDNIIDEMRTKINADGTEIKTHFSIPYEKQKGAYILFGILNENGEYIAGPTTFKFLSDNI